VQYVLIVVVDSATPAITAALAEVTDGGARVLARRVTVDARAHGERLAPSIDAVLHECGAKPRDLAAVVAGVGPGPFTGLRVGLVTAAALADTLGIPAYGVGTLDALGWATTGRVLVATDARRKEVYWAVYEDGRPVTAPAVARPADIAVDVDRAVGDGAHRYADVLDIPASEPWYPPAEGLASLAAQRVRYKAPTEPLTPLYLRRPDAVEPGARKAVS
jgi:tRNA threonylcarbamoyl adenosine modification protein YeaZ